MKKVALALAITTLVTGCSLSVTPKEELSPPANVTVPGAPSASESVSQGYGSKDASADVVVSGPADNSNQFMTEVPITVTNNSEKRSNYAIDVVAESADGSVQYETGFAYVENLEPGQSALETVVFFKPIADPGANYRVVTVSRTAAY